MTYWFPDNSVIVSFSVIDRLPLLKTVLHGRGRVVEAIAAEIERSKGHTPNLYSLDIQEWFDQPIVVDDRTSQAAIERIRKDQFGGTSADYLEHLGESQTLFVMRSRPEFQSSIWITEDRQAYKFAKGQGLTAHDTFDVLHELVAMMEITADQAFDIAGQILDSDQPMLRPPSSWRDFS